MTLGTTHTSLRYDGDGVATDFAVTFEFHDLNDLEVIVVTRETGAEKLKSLGADYSVAGGNGATGTVTMTVAPTAAERLVIRRVSSDQQPDDLVDGGALAAEPLERRLDIIAARLQELETDIARSLKVAKGSQATGLDLNLVGGKNRQLTVASDEQGVILATGTVPDTVQTSQFGEEWVNLNSELEARNLLMLGSAVVENIGTSGATIPLLNGANTHSGANTFSADATFNSDFIVGAPFVLQSEVLTIDAGGQIAPTKSSIFINNRGGASANNLDTIAVTNHSVGSVIKVKAKTSGQVPTLRHAGGNIYLDENKDVVLDDLDKSIWLERREAADGEHDAGWYEIGRSWRVFPAAALFHVRHTAPSGTPGGVPTTGIWTTGPLDDVLLNEAQGAALASNAITLPAGTYDVEAYRQFYRMGRVRIRLFNTTDAATVLVGSSSTTRSAGSALPGEVIDGVPTLLRGRFTLDAEKSLEFQYRVQGGNGSTWGLGVPANFGDLEVYAEIVFRKVA